MIFLLYFIFIRNINYVDCFDMIYLFIEFLDDGFECLEVWFFYWVFCLVLFDDDSKFVIWIVVFFECWLEVRFDFVFYFFVNFCIK